MSDHYLSLKETAKARYRLKLQLLGIPLESDPYTSGNANFQDDMTAWPPVEYGHILVSKGVACETRSHLWVFHTTARSLHSRTATFLETVGFLQLLHKRVREDGDGVGPQKQQLL